MKVRVGVGDGLYNFLTEATGPLTTEIDITPEEHARITRAFAEWDAIQELIDERVEAATRKSKD